MERIDMNAYEWGVVHGSCEEGLEQRKAYASQPEWYLACPRGDWLAWQLKQIPDDLHVDRFRKAVAVIADRAVEAHMLPCPSTKDLAKKWLSREDQSFQAAWDLHFMASTESASWTADAVMLFLKATNSHKLFHVMESARHAARAINAYRYARELRRQADDIRCFIPTWPGED
jgi:hypothetical protein